MCVPSMSCVVFLNSLALAWRMDTRATPEALDRRSVISRRRYSRESIAIIRIGDSVCLSERTIKPKWMKEKPSNLAHRDSPSRYLAHQLVNIRSKSQKVTGSKKCKKSRRDSRAAPCRSAVTPLNETASHGRRELCTLSSAQLLQFHLSYVSGGCRQHRYLNEHLQALEQHTENGPKLDNTHMN